MKKNPYTSPEISLYRFTVPTAIMDGPFPGGGDSDPWADEPADFELFHAAEPFAEK